MNYLAKKYDDKEITIAEHTNNVSNMTVDIINRFSLDKNEEIGPLCYIAAQIHDLGKMTDGFQKHLAGGDNEYDHHNILVAIIWNETVKSLSINGCTGNYKEIILNSVLYHHPITLKYDTLREEFSSDEVLATPEEIENIKKSIVECLERTKKLFNIDFSFYSSEDLDGPTISEDACKAFPVYDNSRNVGRMSILNQMVRNILISADVLSSYDVPNYLDKILLKSFGPSFDFQKPENYDSRFFVQMKYAKEFYGNNNNIVHFNASTGFGKTMTGLLFLLMSETKGWWVCPQNSIAISTYDSVKRELKALGLEKKVSVSLLLTGKYKEGDENSDITITNIDNWIKPTNTSNKLTLQQNIQLLSGTCIFDEYHEFVTAQPLMSAFATVVKMRKKTHSKTLLMTATTNHFLLKELGVKDDACINLNADENKQFLERRFKITLLDKWNGTYKDENALIVCNTVKVVQAVYTKNMSNNIFHAKYFENDRQELMESLLNNHGKINYNNPETMNNSWVTSSIACTGLDFSMQKVVCVGLSPERMLQAWGRGPYRFSFNDNENAELILVRDINKSLDKISPTASQSENSFFLTFVGDESKKDKSYSQYVDGWYEFLLKKIGKSNTITNKELYDYYNEYVSEASKIPYSKCLYRSIDALSKVMFLKSEDNKEDDGLRYSNSRGNNIRQSNTNEVFVRLKDADTGKYYEGDNELLTVNVKTLENALNSDNSIWDTIYKNGINKGIYNKKRGNRKYGTKDEMLKYATRSDKPIFVPYNLLYDKEIGLTKVK